MIEMVPMKFSIIEKMVGSGILPEEGRGDEATGKEESTTGGTS